MNPKLQDIYDQVPLFFCKKHCSSTCGMVPVHPAEIAEIKRVTGKTVPVYETNWGIGYDSVLVIKPADPLTLTCPYLINNECSIYHVRPLMCRLWGVVDSKIMICPHGCRPAHLLSDTQAHGLIRQLDALEVPHDDANRKRPHRK